MNKKYFKLFANCIPVRGYSNSIICDLQKGKYIPIPNELYDILLLCNSNLNISEIKKKYPKKDDKIGIELFFEKLVSLQLGFYTTIPENFINLPNKYKYPGIISNSIIDINSESNHKYSKIISDLEVLNCGHIQLRFYSKTNFNEIDMILSHFTNSCIRSIDVIMPYLPWVSKKSIIELYKKHTRLISFDIYGAKRDAVIQNKFLDIFYHSMKEISVHSCGVISPNLFSITNNTFFESKAFNSCLNQKISIDVTGNIKNCPSMSEHYGNIKETSLISVVEKAQFKKYWNLNKDKISICKDCEFRYICTDCRAYIENPDDIYSKPLKCGYSPYTNKWEDWCTNKLKQKAIQHYNMQVLALKK